MKQTMVYKKSTKGTHVFEAEHPDAVPSKTFATTLYVSKLHFPDGAPQAIELTIEVCDANN